MRKKMQRTLVAILALAIVLTAPAYALSFLFGGKDTEKVQTSTIEDDGLLRVYLKSLNDPESLGLTLAGIYTVENDAGFRFARDTEIVLAAQDGNILLTTGGLTIDMGESLTLTRHQAEEGAENGIYIHESEKDTLFAGDLTVTEVDGGLQCILKIHIEDYLLGVVAYEMSDSFPLEALKAQAVAARTYAMGKKWTSAGRAYDVVDTTQDQVFKGYDARYTNVIQAVEETRGVVGTYNGGFAMCYYTASNGGQTALPTDIWGGSGDYGYLAMVEDPYDLENPSSLVNSLTVSANCEQSAALLTMLQEELAELNLPEKDVQFERVVDVEAVEPASEGSLMYTKLRFTLEASYAREGYAPQEGDQTPPLFGEDAGLADETLSSVAGLALARRGALQTPYELSQGRETLAENPVVELLVYDQIKDGLSLGLNSSDYELVRVEKQTDSEGTLESFTISMRRFGHGVGMSQRGAQWMAGEYEKDYLEILNFYYPGMTVEKIDWPEVELTPLEDLPESIGRARARPTPTPSPAPLPDLEEGEYYASVVLESRASTLNVRESPSTTARVLTVLDYGRRVIVCKEVEDGWARIRTAELEEGYVKLEYLQAE
ncbi:MAG TPA: SpoIID/LytB domain-containing protein [Candidatus Pullichristensenella excrementigallinarum]|uniref:SpoIID/LytB domain-containing protein n=1 Tax=Candidatus Pullichristensenella excrementigallinarum TaxID=2840907 RepID=A0A9D1I9B1_9FIRM|nr:SpoIID/LytB domain-containing protein [Candidatus Pullichristensenella excrementigallinarum]